MSNREWGHLGTNYLWAVRPLAFSAFPLMMVCVAIYAALISSVRISSNMHSRADRRCSVYRDSVLQP